jgi:hypothetical protein
MDITCPAHLNHLDFIVEKDRNINKERNRER